MKTLSLISLIDDDDIYRFMMKKTIENTGLVDSIIQFKNGLEAIEYFSANENQTNELPDCIFLDLEMPFMDGWQFLNKYTQLKFPKQITLFVISSSNSLDDMDKARTFDQVKGYLIKPVNRDEIRSIIKSLLV
ncbi:response regulator [Adhaeribacter aquaticus]|uniref:response regulator n=1 Tax=Adhaeribacter aquaticus TaxID=299567 RepID=UPI0004035CB9|nr:response regulator [Adhaeribacter aquaticus]